jgi:predicted TIM-barrel fold metal-dependent hydrolase
MTAAARQPGRDGAEAARLPIIDADGHVFEPFAIWQERLPKRYREQAFRRSVDPSGRETVYFFGVPADIGYSVGSLCTPGAASADGRLDLDIEHDTHPGASDPLARLALMDRQGVAASVLYPTMGLGIEDLPGPEFRLALARAYNSWIAEFCAVDPIRLRFAAVIPLADVDGALAELERSLAEGASAVMLGPLPTDGKVDLGDRSRDPLWSALVSAGIPAVVHAANPDSPSLGLSRFWKSRSQWQMGVPFLLQLAVLHVIDGHVLDRFPDLRVGFFEGDVGWLPHWLGRLQETYEKLALVSKPPTLPALEQFRRSCVISGEPADPGLAHTAELIGAERVLWASDWPHLDGAWPDPIRLLRERADLSDADKRAIFVHGAAGFYGIDVGGLLAHLGPAWSLDAPLATLPGMLD